MMRAWRGFALTAFSVNRYCDPPRRNEALLILKAPLEVFGIYPNADAAEIGVRQVDRDDPVASSSSDADGGTTEVGAPDAFDRLVASGSGCPGCQRCNKQCRDQNGRKPRSGRELVEACLSPGEDG